MQGALHLTVGAGHAALALGIVFGLNLNDAAVGVFLTAEAFDDVGILQSHFLSGRHSEEFLRCVFHEVGALNPEVARERDGVASCGLILGVVDGVELLGLALGVVGDDELHGVEHSRYTCGALVQILSDGGLEQGDIVEGVELGVADGVDEVLDRFG